MSDHTRPRTAPPPPPPAPVGLGIPETYMDWFGRRPKDTPNPLVAILDAVWQAHQEAHTLRVQHLEETLEEAAICTRYAREDTLILATAYTTLKSVARHAGVEWHGTYEKDAAA